MAIVGVGRFNRCVTGRRPRDMRTTRSDSDRASEFGVEPGIGSWSEASGRLWRYGLQGNASVGTPWIMEEGMGQEVALKNQENIKIYCISSPEKKTHLIYKPFNWYLTLCFNELNFSYMEQGSLHFTVFHPIRTPVSTFISEYYSVGLICIHFLSFHAGRFCLHTRNLWPKRTASWSLPACKTKIIGACLGRSISGMQMGSRIFAPVAHVSIRALALP